MKIGVGDAAIVPIVDRIIARRGTLPRVGMFYWRAFAIVPGGNPDAILSGEAFHYLDAVGFLVETIEKSRHFQLADSITIELQYGDEPS